MKRTGSLIATTLDESEQVVKDGLRSVSSGTAFLRNTLGEMVIDSTEDYYLRLADFNKKMQENGYSPEEISEILTKHRLV